MKAFNSLLIAATLTLAWAQTNGDQIMTQPEAQLIKILKNSHAPLFDRAKACQRLAVVGTRKAVPALSALLSDPKLSHYARFGLEPIPDLAVDKALRAALGKLQGRLLVGVVNSIAQRKDAKAVPALTRLENNPDREVAQAASAALTHIRGLPPVQKTAAREAWHPVVDSTVRLRQLFSNPPAEYSTAPFFVWNGEVTEADIDYFMDSYHSQGIHSVFIHPRPGLITSYLSDRWFSLVRYTVDKAAKLGMEVWLYDENSYPSGFAGGHVPAEMPESYNEGQGLVLHRQNALEAADARKYKLILKQEGGSFRDVTAQAAQEAGQTGSYYCFEIAYYEKRAWHGGYSYVDLIRPGVTEKFIEITMRGYERTLQGDLGHRVPGIFTDEPNINMPRGRDCMRWTPDLFEQFSQRRGYDLTPHLPSLFEETGDWRKVRYDYYTVLLDLFIERWSKPWHNYAQKTGISWTGHYWEHGWPSPNDGPDNMAMYAWHDVPGIDMLFNQFSESVNAQFGNARSVRELASAANQMGRRRTLSETYGGGGWELRFEDMKRLGEWEYVLGVNFMNQHLSFETLMGARKHDYPQSFSYHEPWWKHYHVLADRFARLSLALSSGQQINRILVVEPTTSAWMYAPVGVRTPRMMEIGRSFQEFVNRLEARQVEYDLASENIVRDRGKVADGRLAVGQRSYDLVVLPPGIENLAAPTAKLLEDYVAAGGTVLSLVDPPARVDGASTGRIAKLASQNPSRWLRASAPDDPAVIERFAAQDFRLKWDPSSGGKLFHQRRQLEDGQLVFLANSSLEQRAVGSLKLKGTSITRLDLSTGATLPYPARRDGTSIEMSFELPPAGSLLLVTGGEVKPASSVPSTAEARPVAPAAPLVVQRTSPNTLTIDYCDLKLGDTVEKGLYYYVAGEKVFRHHGLGTDPWNAAVQYNTSILDQNKFPPGSGFQATFYFQVSDSADRSALRAVIERPELWKVAINGHPITNRPREWWLDRAFGVYDISPHVIAGRNAITLTASPMSVHHELEPVYVIGNFGLESQPSGWRLTAPSPLSTGAWKQQGLPFYSNTVSYSGTYRLPTAGRVMVQLGDWHGTVAEVLVNGTSAGVIGWQPYELDITSLVRKGDSRVEVVVYGSLKNLLGPHHGKINRGLTGPPSFRNAPAAQPPGASYDLEPYGLMEDFRVLHAAR